MALSGFRASRDNLLNRVLQGCEVSYSERLPIFASAMANEVPFLSEGFLLDVVDDDWRMGVLPDDGRLTLPHA